LFRVELGKQNTPDATKKNTNIISDPIKLTNSELNAANVKEGRVSCLCEKQVLLV